MSDIAIPQEVWDHQLTASAPTKTAWLWQGFIAPANTTLFTSHGKLGKTTLLSMLLSRRKQGGTLAGLAVKPGRTVVISEESKEVWEERARQFDFGGKVCFIFRPFLTIPTPEDLMRTTPATIDGSSGKTASCPQDAPENLVRSPR
jgi:hypothetical protein